MLTNDESKLLTRTTQAIIDAIPTNTPSHIVGMSIAVVISSIAGMMSETDPDQCDRFLNQISDTLHKTAKTISPTRKDN